MWRSIEPLLPPMTMMASQRLLSHQTLHAYRYQRCTKLPSFSVIPRGVRHFPHSALPSILQTPTSTSPASSSSSSSPPTLASSVSSSYTRLLLFGRRFGGTSSGGNERRKLNWRDAIWLLTLPLTLILPSFAVSYVEKDLITKQSIVIERLIPLHVLFPIRTSMMLREIGGIETVLHLLRDQVDRSDATWRSIVHDSMRYDSAHPTSHTHDNDVIQNGLWKHTMRQINDYEAAAAAIGGDQPMPSHMIATTYLMAILGDENAIPAVIDAGIIPVFLRSLASPAVLLDPFVVTSILRALLRDPEARHVICEYTFNDSDPHAHNHNWLISLPLSSLNTSVGTQSVISQSLEQRLLRSRTTRQMNECLEIMTQTTPLFALKMAHLEQCMNAFDMVADKVYSNRLAQKFYRRIIAQVADTMPSHILATPSRLFTDSPVHKSTLSPDTITRYQHDATRMIAVADHSNDISMTSLARVIVPPRQHWLNLAKFKPENPYVPSHWRIPWPATLPPNIADRFTLFATSSLLARSDHYTYIIDGTSPSVSQRCQHQLDRLADWFDGYDRAMDAARAIFAYSISLGYIISTIKAKGRFISATGLVKIWPATSANGSVSLWRAAKIGAMAAIPTAMIINSWPVLPLAPQQYRYLPWNEPQRGCPDPSFRVTDKRLALFPSSQSTIVPTSPTTTITSTPPSSSTSSSPSSSSSLGANSLGDVRAVGPAGDLSSGTWRDLELTMGTVQWGLWQIAFRTIPGFGAAVIGCMALPFIDHHIRVALLSHDEP